MPKNKRLQKSSGKMSSHSKRKTLGGAIVGAVTGGLAGAAAGAALANDNTRRTLIEKAKDAGEQAGKALDSAREEIKKQQENSDQTA